MGTDLNQCPQCGTAQPAGSPEGLCPRCLMAMNLATQTDFSEDGPHGTKVTWAVPSPEELAGKFPELEILELLGRGGMGAVYKARQKELDRIVALKILPPGIGETPGFAERFAREAKALAKLNHANIVTLYEFGRTDGLFFFLMEYVDGVNLRQLLGAGRVAPREALAIVPQICDALQYAHDQGIVHRDIKPDNVLMDRRGRVKVADFGLAKIVDEATGAASLELGTESAGTSRQRQELTEAGKVMGTPQYMAPEQEQSALLVDHRADIYALGVVFYQMLTGELPGKPLEPPSKKVHIDVRLDAVVLRALENNPLRRYPQASVLKTEVETLAAKAANPLPREQAGAGPRFSRKAIAGAVLVALCLAAGSFLAFGPLGTGTHTRSASTPQSAPELAPKTKFPASLPNGSFVELVSLMYAAKSPRVSQVDIDFWRPDGTRLENNIGWSFGPSTLAAARDPSLEYRAFVARWGGPSTNDTRLMGWQLDENPPDSADGHFTVTPKTESAENWIGLVQGFPQRKSTATVRFALASGPYLEGPKPNHLWSSSDKTPFGSFSMGKIFDHQGNAAVTLTHNLKGCDYRLRIIVDRDPKPKSFIAGLLWEWRQDSRRADRYQPVYGRVVKGGVSNQTFEFPGISAKEAMTKLPRIDFEVRPVQWVEFENVALNPGAETSLQVRVQPEHSGTRPVLEGVLYSVAAQRPVKGIELDGSREIEVPDNLLKRGEDAFFHWIAEQGIDLMAFGQKQRWNLWTSLKLAPMDQVELDQISRTQIEEALQARTNGLPLADPSEWHGTRSYNITSLGLPQTFAFRTVAGRIGVLQLAGYSESPAGVRIRYALAGESLQHAAGNSSPIPPEAAQLLEKIRLLYEQRNGDTPAPGSESEFQRGIAASTKQMNELLKGTAAEPLIRQQEELVRIYLKAREAGDTNAAKEAMDRAKALGKQIVSQINPDLVKPSKEAERAREAANGP